MLLRVQTWSLCANGCLMLCPSLTFKHVRHHMLFFAAYFQMEGRDLLPVVRWHLEHREHQEHPNIACPAFLALNKCNACVSSPFGSMLTWDQVGNHSLQARMPLFMDGVVESLVLDNLFEQPTVSGPSYSSELFKIDFSGKDRIIFVTKEDHETPSNAELVADDPNDPYEDQG